MKRKNTIGKCISLLYFALLLAPELSYSATQTWNNGANNLTWDTSSLNWSGAAWNDGNDAVFGASGSGSILVSGTRTVGNLTINANNYTFSNGSLRLAKISAADTWAINNDTTFSTPISADFSSATASKGGLWKTGSGTLTLAGNINYTNTSTSYSPNLEADAGTLILSGTNLFNNTRLDPNGTSSASGVTWIFNGGSNVCLGPLNLNSGLVVGGYFQGEVIVTNGAYVNASQYVIWFGGGSSVLTLASGTVTTTNNTTSWTASGGPLTNSVTINLNGGVLAVPRIFNSGFGGAFTVNLNGGTFQAAANQGVNIFSLSGANGTAINVQSNGAVIDTAGYNVTQTQPLLAGSPSGGLTKLGAGTLTLAGTNTYTGQTKIEQGTLSLGANGLLASTVISLGSNCSFDVSGLPTPLSLNAGQTLSNSATLSSAYVIGNLDATLATIAFAYTNGTPGLMVTNGTLFVANTTSLSVNNWGPPLGPGIYPLIAVATNGRPGAVSAYSLPTVNLGGNGTRAGTGTPRVLVNSSGLNLLIPPSDFAFYVSPSGSDTNSGTIDSPWKTLAAAVAILSPGDTLYLRAGTYRETITLQNSGTPGAPITISGYSNEAVVISGADILTNTWTAYNNKIFQVQMPWTMDDENHWWHYGMGGNQIFVDGAMMVEARWPNLPDNLNPAQLTRNHMARAWTGAIIATNLDAGNETGQYILPGLPGGTNDMQGAAINFLAGAMWTPMSGTVLASSNGLVTFQCPILSASQLSGVGYLYYPRTNDAFFVWNKLSLLDTNREWFRDTNTGTLYLWTPAGDSPTNHLVEAKHRDLAINVNGQSYVTIQNLSLFAAGLVTGIKSSLACSNLLLNGINAQYVAHATWHRAAWDNPVNVNSANNRCGTFWLNGTNITVMNSTILYSATEGISISCDTLTVSNCCIGDAGYSGFGANLNIRSGNNIKVIGNSLYGTGYLQCLDYYNVSNLMVSYNNLSYSARQCMDNGTILGGPAGNVEISYNYIHDSLGLLGYGWAGYFGNAAVYLGGFMTNTVIHHNVAWNMPRGIKLYPAANSVGVSVVNNTIVGKTLESSSSDTSNAATVLFQNNIGTGIVLWGTALATSISNNLYTPGNETVNPGFLSLTNLNFSLNSNSPCIGAGRSLAPYTDGYNGSAPDIGAFEYGGPIWSPGTNGWTVNQPVVQNNGASATSNAATFQGLLVSSGLAPATVQLFWGPTDGGNNFAAWANHTNIGTGYLGSYLTLTKTIGNLAGGAVVSFRFCASNSSAVSWSSAQSVTVPTSSPVALTGAVSSNRLYLSWPASGWVLQVQTNGLNVGLQIASNAWLDVPGTAGVSSTNLPILTTNGSVFYRLRQP